MAEKIVMPKLGATMEEGVIDSWLVDIGEEVEEGDPIAEVQTDKITMEIEAESTGVLLKTLYEPGDTVPVQQVIAYIGEEGEEVDEGEDMTTESSLETTEEGVEQEASIDESEEQVESPFEQTDKIRRTPIARRLAEENDVNLQNVSGTGPLGRIQKQDIEQYLTENTKRTTPLAKKIAQDQQVDFNEIAGTGARGKVMKEDVIGKLNKTEVETETTEDVRVPFKGMRKVIADRISESFHSAPHVTLNGDVDVTEVVKLRQQLLPVIEEAEGLRVSYNEIIIKAVAFALKQNPSINISLDGKEIVQHGRINIGMAVAVPDGLVVPVIRNADKKGLATLTRDAKSLAKQAKSNALTPEDMSGSTFTISNLGMYAVDDFTPIINQPNAAILGVGRIVKKPVVVGEEVEVRSMMGISLSFDHRIVDGAPAAQFLTDIKDVLENPYKLMV